MPDLTTHGPARIEQERVQNYRALRSVDLKDITPLTVLLGPNGSGKSTFFDVFNFLSECFQFGHRHALDRRGRAKELKTRGQTGPVMIESKGPRGPYVADEWIQWRRGIRGRPFRFLEYREGRGRAARGEMPERARPTHRNPTQVAGPDRRQCAGPARRSPACRRIARIHHGLVRVLPVYRKHPRPARSRSPRTAQQDRG